MDNQAGVARARAKDTREAWAEVVPSAWDLIPIADLYSRVLYEKLQPTNSFPPNRTHLITSLAFFLPRHSSTLTPHSPTTTMAPIKILIINPNTNQSMTDSLRDPIESLGYNNVQPPPSNPLDPSHPPTPQFYPITPLPKPQLHPQAPTTPPKLTPPPDNLHLPHRPLRPPQHRLPRRRRPLSHPHPPLPPPPPPHPRRLPRRLLLPAPARPPPQTAHRGPRARHHGRERRGGGAAAAGGSAVRDREHGGRVEGGVGGCGGGGGGVWGGGDVRG